MPTYSDVVRTLREGSVQIKDNATPTAHTCTIVCDEGDLKWRETNDVKIVKCRGNISDARGGDEVPCELSLTIKWMQLIQQSVNDSDPVAPYEFINGLNEDYVSFSPGYYCLQWIFTVENPQALATTNEKITFNKVYCETLECSEGDEKQHDRFQR